MSRLTEPLWKPDASEDTLVLRFVVPPLTTPLALIVLATITGAGLSVISLWPYIGSATADPGLVFRAPVEICHMESRGDGAFTQRLAEWIRGTNVALQSHDIRIIPPSASSGVGYVVIPGVFADRWRLCFVQGPIENEKRTTWYAVCVVHEAKREGQSTDVASFQKAWEHACEPLLNACRVDASIRALPKEALVERRMQKEGRANRD